MSQTHEDIRALRVMVDELRAEPPPEMPWDAIEARLFARIAEEGRARQAMRRVARARPAPSAFSRVIGFAAAAAALAFGIGATSRTGELTQAHAPARHVVEASAIATVHDGAGSSAHDLARLAPGDVVEAGDAPVSFTQPGLVEWTLAPGSALRVQSVGVGHTVALERGSLRAEVTPRAPSEGLVEAFAVEVAGTRVAVHGTAFSVKIEGGRAVVDVEHGTVAVGPVGHVGVTTGHMLVGPSRAVFSLDGGRSARLIDRTPEPVAVAVAAATHTPIVGHDGGEGPASDDHGAVRTSDAVAPPAQTPSRHGAAHGAAPPAVDAGRAAPPEPPRLTVETVRARLERCFRSSSAGASSSSSLHIEPISTTLSIDLNPDGTVRRSTFTKQLKPEFYPCAGSAISGRFPDNLGHVDVPVTFQP